MLTPMKHLYFRHLLLAAIGLLVATFGATADAPQQELAASSAAPASGAAPANSAAPAASAAPIGGAAKAAAGAPATTTDAVPLPASAETLRAVAVLAGVKVENVQSTPIAGIFEVLRGSDILYMTRDGQYAFTGDLYQVPSRANLTEVHRRDLRRKLIEAVPESRMVVFSPADPKYTVTVFTDVDCGYCRALHRQIADYNRLGVRVRYVFFPRTGPNTASWHKAEQVWCSADRKAALTRAKLGETLEAPVCSNTPVAQEYELGQAIGLEGTPGIVAANGALVGGYLPPDALVEQLKKLQP
jgi:thiol:disulfide interchange protein DsbC